MEIAELERKIEKKACIFKIIAFEFGVANSRNIQEDTWHRQAMCQQTHLRFHLILGETFSVSNSPRMMQKNDKCAVIEISQVFGTLSHVDGESVFRNGGF